MVIVCFLLELPETTLIEEKVQESEAWARPLVYLWQTRPRNFNAEKEYNAACAKKKPHCAICTLLMPYYKVSNKVSKILQLRLWMKCEIATWLLNFQEIIKKINLGISFLREVNKLTTIKIRTHTVFTFICPWLQTLCASYYYLRWVHVSVCVFSLEITLFGVVNPRGFVSSDYFLTCPSPNTFYQGLFYAVFLQCWGNKCFQSTYAFSGRIFPWKQSNAEHCLILSCGITVLNGK